MPSVILTSLEVSRAEFENATGWTLKTEGACRGDVCVPLGTPPSDSVEVGDVAGRLGMPLVEDRDRALWSLGPASVTGRALTSAQVPDIFLPDVNTGKDFSLASLKGRKTVMVAWASW